ncbi:MAG: cellulase family glycosylhydrolase [Anaerolineae bacterium]|nr:cellulase family glycosylhydrolase [Anaerolineae bacterium]
MSIFSWPAKTAQVEIAVPYNPDTGIIEIYAPAGTLIRAISAGTITSISSDQLHLAAFPYNVIYMGLQTIRVKPGATVNAGDVIAESGSPETIKLIIYQTIDPTDLFDRTPPVEEPDEPDTETVYLKPTESGLRVREAPINGKPIGNLSLNEVVTSLEPAAETKAKVGQNNEWIHIRRRNGVEGYTAAWFLKLAKKPPEPTFGGSLTGLNLDIFHHLGAPDPKDMQGVGWVRLKFNMSLNPDKPQGDPARYGNTDLNATYNRYRPYIEKYAQAGMHVLLVLTHQLYGEGAGFNWQQMDPGKWAQLTSKYADYAGQVAQRFAGSGFISAYQIWNEQDTHEGRAAVAMPPTEYGKLLTATIRAIRQADPTVPIITGGHTSGPDAGSAYARKTLAAMPEDVRPDGIAIHPYGRGVRGHRFSNWGGLDEELDKYSVVMPDKPLWITEWGVLDQQGRTEVIPDVADYAAGFVDICKNQYAGQVITAIWYAWADSMDNGFGLVDQNGKPKAILHEKFRNLG